MFHKIRFSQKLNRLYGNCFVSQLLERGARAFQLKLVHMLYVIYSFVCFFLLLAPIESCSSFIDQGFLSCDRLRAEHKVGLGLVRFAFCVLSTLHCVRRFQSLPFLCHVDYSSPLISGPKIYAQLFPPAPCRCPHLSLSKKVFCLCC